MKTFIALGSSALFLLSLAVGGCAADGEDGSADDSADVDLASGITPNRLGAGSSGYIPRVKLADLRAAGANCAGTTCRLGGQVWDCKGGGYCAKVDSH